MDPHDKITRNPFSDVASDLNRRYAQNDQLPQFGLAAVTAVEPELHVTFAGLDFGPGQLLLNFTLRKHTVGFDATQLSGQLYGATEICGAGFRHHQKNITSAGGLRSVIGGDMEIDPRLEPGDRLLAFYSQADQLLVLLVKAVS